MNKTLTKIQNIMKNDNSMEEEGREEILLYLDLNCDEAVCGTPPAQPTSKLWSVADLFIRQHLNNGCDGFGLKNVNDVYEYLVSNKATLLFNHLVSEAGYNNSGFPLWKDYDF